MSVPPRAWLWIIAFAAPTWVAYSQAPITVFYNAALSVFGVGLLLLLLPAWRGSWAGPGAFAVSTAAAAWLAWQVTPLNALLLAGAAAVLTAGFCLSRNDAAVAMRGLAFAGLGAGVLSALIGLSQYVAPDLLPRWLVAMPATAGRAVGNLRQPNQLATLLMLAICALAWMGSVQRWRWQALLPVQALLVLGVVLTSSRMGWLMIGMTVLWGVFDRRLSRPVRGMLIFAAPAAALATALAWAWGHWGGVTYFGEARLATQSDISSSRFGIWSNTLELIRRHPISGVGWGDFNFAWSLTPFPGRPIAFFDHTHHLVLQLAVELGLPFTAALIALFCWTLWHARRGVHAVDEVRAVTARVALMMVALVLLHSLLEYPLWYPYFLFPTAFALGIYLGTGWPATTPAASPDTATVARSGQLLQATVRAAGVLMVLGSLYAVWDYQRIVQIFAPYGATGERPLAERIREGQKSWLFGHHADYAAVTTARHPSQVFAAFERPLHKLIDARLMVAYIKALTERGEDAKAAYVAQRLREFRHPLGQEFLAACDDPAPMSKQPPPQCDTRMPPLGFEDFR
ncbi:Wzy polymerase domain-containing protein [Aquabacterium sp. A7-Y]|uniref:PglL family O-oligosaccharyltransferase n=1 Tax=Aquabacterium sp. A7-Y TaxID=1349605 RepID=UPI00223E8872|nr:O-antigen ligase family protein [Aquabacterium sp. A7-Y]MCW7538977.1 Wzy polymerase domain-containing protein [Aquabacterium sp. A7-Y]